MKVTRIPHRVELLDDENIVLSCHRMARGTFWLGSNEPRELSKKDLEELATALLKLARSSAKADDAAYVEAW